MKLVCIVLMEIYEDKKRIRNGEIIMQTAIGKEGKNLTWQNEFPLKTQCSNCHNMAELAMTIMEDGSDNESVFALNVNDPHDEGLWPHDSIAIANYICRKCLKVTSLMNQA